MSASMTLPLDEKRSGTRFAVHSAQVAVPAHQGPAFFNAFSANIHPSGHIRRYNIVFSYFLFILEISNPGGAYISTEGLLKNAGP